MDRKRHVGRAEVRRHVGRAAVRRIVAAAPVPQAIRTHVLKVGDEPRPPVFVDSSGRRKRRLRRLAYALCVAALLLVAVLWLSQAGDDVRPKPMSPVPAVPASPSTAGQVF